MSREVKNRVSLDASRFQRGTAQVQRNIKQLEKGLTIDFKRAAQLGGRAMFAVGAAGAAVGTGLAVGINRVIELGAELDHLKTQTGIAVSDLLILRQVFEDSGVSADNARLAVNKMQKTIIDAEDGLTTATRAFDLLNLDFKELKELSAAEQFRIIGNAIAAVPNQAEKAAAAMGIFGRSGAEMLTVFGGNKIEDAAANIGRQAQLLEKNSVLFERISTLMGRTGNKLQGFFVGIADKVAPVILPLLERLDGMDLSEQGQRFGEGLQSGLRAVVGLFEQNTIGDLFTESLILSGKTFINEVAKGWLGLGKGLFLGLKEGLPSFLSALKAGFLRVGEALNATILDMLGTALRKMGFEEKGFALVEMGNEFRSDSLGRAKEISDKLDASVEKFSKGFTDGMADLEDFEVFKTEGNTQKIAELVATAIRSLKPAVPSATVSTDSGNGLDLSLDAQASDVSSIRNALFGGVSSLAAIGGGGGVGTSTATEALVDQSRQQTKIQSETLSVMKQVSDRLLMQRLAPTYLG